jgi:Holliday junction resolvase RusA-like endonuclease
VSRTLSLIVPGEPVPLERARKGKGNHWYLPPRSREFRERIQTAWLVEGRVDLGDSQLELAATFVCAKPDGKDVSNMLKACEDALQDQHDGSRLCFRDDAQIARVEAGKRRVGKLEEPHTELDLRAVNG